MSTRRLFFALWLDEAAAQTAHRQAEELGLRIGGRAMRADSLHLTLAFLGNVAENRQPALLKLGQSIAATTPPFALEFDRFAYWPHNRIVVATCRNPPAALPALAGALRNGLSGLGLPTDSRPFFPHLTLLRKLPTAPADATLTTAIPLSPKQLQLAESLAQPGGGYRYQAFAEWPLDG